MDFADPKSGAGACAAAATTAALAAALVQKIWGDPLAGELGEKAAALAVESEEAFLQARAELARAGEGGRDEAIGHAMDRATAAPLAVAGTAVDIAELALAAADKADPTLRAEVVTAAILCEAVAATCAHLVQINLVNERTESMQSEARVYATRAATIRAALTK